LHQIEELKANLLWEQMQFAQKTLLSGVEELQESGWDLPAAWMKEHQRRLEESVLPLNSKMRRLWYLFQS
jgi:hypothetical protein